MRRLAVIASALALSGCGVGPGETATAPSGVSVTVTRDFGAQELGRSEAREIPAGETVMRLLQRRFDVETRYGGGFVDAIDGLAGGTEGGRRVDWFYYVNGIESSEGASGRKVNDGDRVWWDHHDWGVTNRVPAVVGSFPEPFLAGAGGRRLPVRLDCASDSAAACDEVAERLDAAGVPASKAIIGAPSGIEVLRIVVGTWRDARRDPTVQLLSRGPEVSGVYVRPREDGFELLDARGRVARRLGAGDGLVAATRYAEQQPTWIVTGVDAAGLAAAVDALEEGVLAQRFAVAVDDGRSLGVPVA